MENLKIKVSNEAESREVQKLFFELGLRWYSSNKKYFLHTNKPYLCTEDGKYICFGEKISNFDDCDGEEITLQELLDMVVLKRNDVSDATHEDYSGLKHLLLTHTRHVWGGYMWLISSADFSKLKPIKEGVMKEYLVKTDSGNYLYTKNASDIAAERVIEIPEGVNLYARCNIFGDYRWLTKIIDGDWEVLWQRGKESLNEKIATAEVVRQEEKHSHYKKDVSHLKMIDPYRIADLYNLHPCADHIMKKSLCAGSRGHKDTLRDIQDIIDTAERWKQMIEEDGNEI